jgi:hypothetical protein
LFTYKKTSHLEGENPTFLVTFCPFLVPLGPAFYIMYLAYCSVLGNHAARAAGGLLIPADSKAVYVLLLQPFWVF